jgi:hypothetical protein
MLSGMGSRLLDVQVAVRRRVHTHSFASALHVVFVKLPVTTRRLRLNASVCACVRARVDFGLCGAQALRRVGAGPVGPSGVKP